MRIGIQIKPVLHSAGQQSVLNRFHSQMSKNKWIWKGRKQNILVGNSPGCVPSQKAIDTKSITVIQIEKCGGLQMSRKPVLVVGHACGGFVEFLMENHYTEDFLFPIGD